MLTTLEHTQVYIAPEPVDFRKQIDGLCVYVQEVLEFDPLSSHLFVFRDRSGKKIKVLYWHRNGFCLLYKRMPKQRFIWPTKDQSVFRCGVSELQWLLNGADIRGTLPPPNRLYRHV